MKIIDGKTEENSVLAEMLNGNLLLVDAVRYRFHTLIADKAKTFAVLEKMNFPQDSLSDLLSAIVDTNRWIAENRVHTRGHRYSAWDVFKDRFNGKKYNIGKRNFENLFSCVTRTELVQITTENFDKNILSIIELIQGHIESPTEQRKYLNAALSEPESFRVWAAQQKKAAEYLSFLKMKNKFVRTIDSLLALNYLGRNNNYALETTYLFYEFTVTLKKDASVLIVMTGTAFI